MNKMNVSKEQMVRSASVHIAFVIMVTLLPMMFFGCDTLTTTTDIQDVSELRWLPDGSALFGFIQKLTLTQYQTYPSASYNPCKFNGDGSLNKIISADQSAVTDYSFSIYPSPDGTRLVTQLGGDLYIVNANTGAYSKIDSFFHLMVVSPDLRYAVGTFSPDNAPVKTVQMLDISTQPVRSIWQKQITGVVLTSGMWLGGTIGINIRDSIGEQIDLYDSTGNLLKVIGGAEGPTHNFTYISSTNDLYFRNHAGKSNDYSIDKVNLSSMQRTNVLTTSVENFDVTPDEGAIVYTVSVPNSDSSVYTTTMYAKNLSTGNQKTLTTDVRSFCILSPDGTRIAYLHYRGGDVNYTEPQVMTLSRP